MTAVQILAQCRLPSPPEQSKKLAKVEVPLNTGSATISVSLLPWSSPPPVFTATLEATFTSMHLQSSNKNYIFWQNNTKILKMCLVKVTLLLRSCSDPLVYSANLGFNSTGSLQVCVHQLKYLTERNLWEQWQQLQEQRNIRKEEAGMVCVRGLPIPQWEQHSSPVGLPSCWRTGPSPAAAQCTPTQNTGSPPGCSPPTFNVVKQKLMIISQNEKHLRNGHYNFRVGLRQRWVIDFNNFSWQSVFFSRVLLVLCAKNTSGLKPHLCLGPTLKLKIDDAILCAYVLPR